MEWRARLAGVIDAVEGLQAPAWLAPTATFAALVLLLALLALLGSHLRLRRALSGRAETMPEPPASACTDTPLRAVALAGEGEALVDRWLPRRPRTFLLTVTALAVGCWGLGLALATDASAFLASREWQSQPLYLAAHFITLRLFATAFTRTFLAGIAHLEIAPQPARRRMSLVLGPVGAAVAAAAAVPFCLYDYRVLADSPGGEGTGPAADLLLFGMWCAEWFLMAFIWVLLSGYMLLTHWAISRHRFRAAIEMVLHDRQYRPFLQMSVQGASIVLAFWIINVAYVWYSGGELSDYTGAAVTLALVAIGFLPPLVELRGKVSRAVSEEMASLRRRLDRALANGDAAPVAAARAIEERLDAALVMLRISYLERLYGELGQSEAMDIVVKLLVPITTVAWYGYKYYKGMP